MPAYKKKEVFKFRSIPLTGDSGDAWIVVNMSGNLLKGTGRDDMTEILRGTLRDTLNTNIYLESEFTPALVGLQTPSNSNMGLRIVIVRKETLGGYKYDWAVVWDDLNNLRFGSPPDGIPVSRGAKLMARIRNGEVKFQSMGIGPHIIRQVNDMINLAKTYTYNLTERDWLSSWEIIRADQQVAEQLAQREREVRARADRGSRRRSTTPEDTIQVVMARCDRRDGIFYEWWVVRDNPTNPRMGSPDYRPRLGDSARILAKVRNGVVLFRTTESVNIDAALDAAMRGQWELTEEHYRDWWDRRRMT